MNAIKDLPIIVAGAGLGGLCAGLALARKGIRVKVLERAPEVGEIGYGIQIAPNGHEILARLGVMKRLEEHVFYPDALVLVDAVTMQEVGSVNLGARFQQHYGRRYFVVHRRDLHFALLETASEYDNFSFEQGEVDSYENHADSVTVRCSNGKTYEARAMIGAEGLRSKTRARIVKDNGPRPEGYVVYRGLVPVEEVTHKKYLDSMVIYGGPGCHMVQYRLRGGTVLNNVATFASPSFKKGNRTDYGGVDELHHAYDQCAPQMRELLKYFSLEKNWQLHDLEPATNWTDGNVTLLGDAAHATLQYLAQGAIMAFEDCVILADELSKELSKQPGAQPQNVNAALINYQNQRMNRSARLVLSARLFGEIIHAGAGARLLRNEIAAGRPNDGKIWELDWLYRGAPGLVEKI
jgi:salicylate hydroxylase